MDEYTTLDAEAIAAMSDEEARDMLDALARSYFDKDVWRPDFANLAGIQTRTPQIWMQKRPPVWAILLLASMINERESVNHLKNLAKLLRFADTLE